MRFKRYAICLLLGLASAHLRAQDGAAQLSAKPNKCIALRKGQACYQTVHFYWQTPATGNYCLVAEGQAAPLHSLQGFGVPPLRYEFVGQQSQAFFIRSEQGETLAQMELAVAWVYTSGQRGGGGWRLF
jgi:hypothetical protein